MGAVSIRTPAAYIFIEVVTPPDVIWIPVAIRFGDQPYRHAALNRADHRVRVTGGGDLVNDDVDAGRLGVVMRLGSRVRNSSAGTKFIEEETASRS